MNDVIIWRVLFVVALQGTDYQLVSNNVTFVSGQAYNHNNKQCIHITVLDDTALESVERFTLSIITASPGVTGSICCIVIDILEDYSDCKFYFVAFNLILFFTK